MAQIRSDIAIVFHDSGSILRTSGSVSDGMGGWSGSTVVSGSVLCTVKASGNQPYEGVIGEKLAGRQLYLASLPANTDIMAADRLQVAVGIPTPVVRTFEILAVIQPTWEFVRKLYLAEVK